MAKPMEPAMGAPQKPAVPEADVMDAMQGTVPSQKGRMPIMSILKKGLEARQTGMPFEQFASFIGARLSSKNNSLVQINNTAFLVIRDEVDPSRVQFGMISADSPKMALQSISGFYKFLTNQGITSAVTTEEKPEFVDLYKKAGVPIDVQVAPGFYGDERKPEYRVSFVLRGAA